jgi:hypothetical protein
VKNQYFGDRRDLRKYDLLLQLLEDIGLRRLVNVLMLTEKDDTNEGKITGYVQDRSIRDDVYHFLRYCLSRGYRDTGRLKELFGGRHFAYCHYDRPFTHGGRVTYFSSLPKDQLQEALIFCDPDIGLEARTMKEPEKYLLYSEAKDIYARMDGSVLVIFHHLHRNKTRARSDYLARGKKLAQTLDTDVLSLDDLNVGFLVVAQVGALPCLRTYSKRHGLSLDMIRP